MSAPQLAPGTVVAQKYQLGAYLGYGGSSATYQAVGSDGREVVLKIFDPAIRQRADIMSAIEQTYAATNALPQDIAVPLLDAGYDATTGAPFSVGERIPFASLAQIASQRPLGPEEVASFLGVMAQLLDQAHARQLFHHALKPTNVFVGQGRQGYSVRVTDFGAGLPRAAVPTQEGYALAAPWLAPEQVQGSVPAGAAADVFATALVMFFALTGRPYWRSCQGTIDLPGWQRELMSPRTPPSARALQLGAQLNSMFDGVLGCALSADPGQRYRSVRELSQAFEALLIPHVPEGQATMALPASAFHPPGGAGGYPPPPAPTGGYQAGPGPAAGMPAYGAPELQPQYGVQPVEANPYGAQAPYGGQDQPPASPAYVSTQAAGPPAQLAETAAGRPVDATSLQRRGSPNRLAPILVGLAALLTLGGAAAAWVVMGKRASSTADTQPSATASAPSPAVAESAPASSASASSAPPAESAPAPADSSSAAPDADAGPPAVLSTLGCDPQCDTLTVDEHPIDQGKPFALASGKHVVVATKDGFVTIRDMVKLKDGEKLEKTYTMKEKPAPAAVAPGPAASPGPAPAAKQPCGKFLKRCK